MTKRERIIIMGFTTLMSIPLVVTVAALVSLAGAFPFTVGCEYYGGLAVITLILLNLID
jgi:hypothetical protein